jgi:lipopolysaccharide transport system permease protein
MNSFITLFRNIYRYRYLIMQMIKREIASRYQGSALGIIWSFLNPLLMLIVYTFVFSVVFKSRWGNVETEESRIDFAITLFAGLIIFQLFTEIMNRAPALILGNVNYVKKVIFPIELLPFISTGVMLFHASISLLVLITVQILYKGSIPWTIVYLPLILLPLLLAGLGVSWFLASISVYIRDIPQIIGVFTTVLMFISAVFFPISALPENYQLMVKLNPLAIIINESRNSLIFGEHPDWGLLGLMMLIGLMLASGGYWWFQKTRKGFADVL